MLVNPAVPQCIICVIRFRNPSLLGGSSSSFASGCVAVAVLGLVVLLWGLHLFYFTWWTGSLAMHQSALSQHVALVSVKRDRAKEGLRINEGELRDKSG